MASRKNRSRKANRRSPKSAAGWRNRLVGRCRDLLGWIEVHRWAVISIGVVVLLGGSFLGSYWLADRLDSLDRATVVKDALNEMKRESRPQPQPTGKYARIEDIPGLPQYTETEPGQVRSTIEEPTRKLPKPTQVAAVAPSERPAWRRNAVPFDDLYSRPLIAIVIDDVGLDRPRSKRAASCARVPVDGDGDSDGDGWRPVLAGCGHVFAPLFVMGPDGDLQHGMSGRRGTGARIVRRPAGRTTRRRSGKKMPFAATTKRHRPAAGSGHFDIPWSSFSSRNSATAVTAGGSGGRLV